MPYRVVYSERVRRALMDLLSRAKALGFAEQVLQAIKEIDARLRLYPQFGEPLRQLKQVGQTMFVGTVAPLVVQYIIDEENRLVFVVVPLKPLPNSGL